MTGMGGLARTRTRVVGGAVALALVVGLAALTARANAGPEGSIPVHHGLGVRHVVPQRVPHIAAVHAAIARNGSVLGSPVVSPATAGATTATPYRPNIVMITADDMSVVDLPYMPHVRALLMDQGTVMRDAIAPTSLCVPARASLLTGQYATNHGDHSISGPHGGFVSLPESDTLPVWLHAAGYNTYFTGKYLNGYGVQDPHYVPPGWTDWRGTVDWTTYNFFDTVVNHDGRLRRYPGTYSTDLVRSQAMAQMRMQQRSTKPFFQWISYVAPHTAGSAEPGESRSPVRDTVPAPRDRGGFRTLPLPHNPSMFEADTSDKPAASPTHRIIDPRTRELLRIENVKRIEALQDVDRSVAATIARIRAMGELDRTVFIFGSDNGYVTGQHNLNGKLWEYDDIIRIPMVLRGPGIPRGAVSTTPVSNPDIAATITALAHATPGRRLDGVDIYPWLSDDHLVRVVPIVAWPVDNGGAKPLYTGVRVGTWTYVRYGKGGEEMYDRSIDPWEVTNLARVPAFHRQLVQLRRLSVHYRHCRGGSCPHRFYRQPSAAIPGSPLGLPSVTPLSRRGTPHPRA